MTRLLRALGLLGDAVAVACLLRSIAGWVRFRLASPAKKDRIRRELLACPTCRRPRP